MANYTAMIRSTFELGSVRDAEQLFEACVKNAFPTNDFRRLELIRFLREERYMQTWVIRILLNECDRIRRKNARVVPMEDVRAVQAGSGKGALKQAILDLEESLRLPILLYYIEGYNVAEVSRMLRLPQGTVKSRLSRGRKQLRTMLEDEVFEP